MLNGLGLFSGIGGIELGLHRAGLLRTTCFVEFDPYAQKVLAKRFPEVPIWDDVRTFHGKQGQFDIITGGFPCQDISVAGKGAGIKEGTRSGLWSEFHRIIGEVRPTIVLIENVPMLLVRGGTRVLADLAEIGYDAEWCIISAAEMGAPHLRKRIFIVAYTNSNGKSGRSINEGKGQRKLVSHPEHNGCAETKKRGSAKKTTRKQQEGTDGTLNLKGTGCISKATTDVDYANEKRPQRNRANGKQKQEARHRKRTFKGASGGKRGMPNRWATEPNVGRVANGVPNRVDRLKCLGNAVVPQCAEYIGRLIMERVE